MDSSQDGWWFYLHNYSALKAQVLINVLMVGCGFKLLLVILPHAPKAFRNNFICSYSSAKEKQQTPEPMTIHPTL